jgi:predicted nucleic acid-binding protein
MCGVTQLGFVRHSVNPSVVQTRATARDAIELLRAMTGVSGYVFWQDISIPTSDDAAWGRVVGHQQVTDAYLLALAKHYDGRVATFDRGLAALDPSRVELLNAV